MSFEFFAATTMTRVVTWQMFATVTQSNKVRTSRYWYMLSIIYWSKYSVSFVWRSCAEKNSASVYTWCVNIHSLLNCTWVKIFTHFTAMLWLKFPSRLRLCVGTICTLTSFWTLFILLPAATSWSCATSFTHAAFQKLDDALPDCFHIAFTVPVKGEGLIGNFQSKVSKGWRTMIVVIIGLLPNV